MPTYIEELLHVQTSGNLQTICPHSECWWCSWKPAAVLMVASATFFSAVSFTAEPLLACVVAGLVTTNRR